MASGSSKGFDFGSDDVLCSFDSGNNNNHSDPVKDFRDARVGRSSLNVYNLQEETFSQEVISTVEKAMKKYADNLLQFLEGFNGRLAKLESYCYNLERSVGELHSDLIRDHNEADIKLRSIENHLQEIKHIDPSGSSILKLKKKKFGDSYFQVHRSLQILRDKQELAETQKELAKLQLVQEAPTMSRSHHNEERSTTSTSEPTKHENSVDTQSRQLLLPPPHQGIMLNSQQGYKELPIQQPATPSLPPQQTSQLQSQQSYYPQQTQLSTQVAQIQQHHQPATHSFPTQQPSQLQAQPHHQDQHVQSEIQYGHQPTQIPDLPRQITQPHNLVMSSQAPPIQHHPQPTTSSLTPPQTSQLPIQQHHQDQHVQTEIQYGHRPTRIPDPSRQPAQSQTPVNQTQTHPYPQYQQQQWPQQIPQQVQPQQPSQLRSQAPISYPPYQHQTTNLSPEAFAGSLPVQVTQVPFSGISENRQEAPVYGFGGGSRTFQQQAPQHNIPRQPQSQTSQSGYGTHSTDGSYAGGGPHPPASNTPTLMMYSVDNTRFNPQFQQGNYPPTHVSDLQNQQPTSSVGLRHPGMQPMPNHPYGEIIEKAASMGFSRDQVGRTIQRMVETGQPLDFNTLLDQLNGHASGTSQRVWSG